MSFISKKDQAALRLIEKYGLSDSKQVTRIFLTSTQIQELLNNVFYTDFIAYTTINHTQYFYLTYTHNEGFELFCILEKPKNPITIENVKSREFTKVYIKQKDLVYFLEATTPLKVVETHGTQ